MLTGSSKLTTKVLVVGSGGREHALLQTLQRTSKLPLSLFSAPGNGGISQLATCVPIPANDILALLRFARAENIDLTIVGPEGPLADGIVDEFEGSGLKIIGPSRAAARLEASKSFAKDFMQRHEIPTAPYAVANSAGEAVAALRSGKFGPPESAVVVKADGLAAGKGVVVARSHDEAERAVVELLSGSLVAPQAAQHLVIEAALAGREVSVLLFADGRDYVLMPAARDHKRIGENDTGPNTGGMGAITDAKLIDSETLNRIVRDIVVPTLEGAVAEGFPFRGILFIGLMLTATGPQVLEYNVRFGDPETQAVLVRLQTDLWRIFQAMITGKLGDIDVDWSEQASACVVLASGGYPGAYETGVVISGLERLAASDSLQVFHAGTEKSRNGDFVTSGGRVLGVTSTGTTLVEALRTCYEAIGEVNWKGMQYRRDIGRFSESHEW
ncbi:MAG: phosphoribosylamine---glycine ligase [Pyrinomonadaceae bacterium]|nr:phosphoribosylamine---glycine ligase [Pyrinomonadaceae bacterium]